MCDLVENPEDRLSCDEAQIIYHGFVVERMSTRADNWCLKVSPTVGLPLVVLDIVCLPPRSSSRTPNRSYMIIEFRMFYLL